MATKVNTANIFASLQDDSDNEAPVVKNAPQATKAPVVAEQKPAQQDGQRQQRGQGRGQPRGERREGAGEQNVQGKDNTQRPKHSREGQKPKGVPAEPHPQDRKSGTGISGVERRFRKDGGGRGNYGTVKNEVQDINKQEAPKVEEPVVAVVEPEEPVVVDNTITVNEYFQRLGVANDAPVQPVVQRQLNLDELKREKLEVVSSRSEKVLDATAVKKSAKSHNKANTTYLLGCNTDHSELLGVKTGTTLVKYSVKLEGTELVGEEKKPAVTTQAPRENRENARNQNNRQPRTLKKVVTESESDFPKLA